MNKLQGKKIVMLLGSDFSHDSRVLKETTSAAEAGLRVTLLARKSRDTKWCEKRNGFLVLRYQTWIDWIWARVSPNGGQEVAGSQSAGTNLPRGLVTYISILNLWFLNRIFVREALRIKPDLVHVNDSIMLPAAYRLKQKGLKVIFDAHELYSQSVANPGYFWQKYYINLEKKINSLDGIFSVCQSILDELDQRYSTKVLPQAILFNAPPYKKMLFHPAGQTIKLLYLGNLQSTRDFSFLHKAISKLDHFTLTHIGPGWGRSVPSAEVVEAANDYDIGIIPYIADNLNNKYSTPNKLFEYMMAGLAVAAADLVEISRIINECQNGALFNPKSTKDIVRAISSLADRKKLENFKQNSLNCAKKYAWEKQAKKQIDLYAKIIEKK